jgi:methyl acetate hydrolase
MKVYQRIGISMLLNVTAVISIASGCLAQDTAEIDKVLRTAVTKGFVPGVVAIAATSDQIVYQGAFGKRNTELGEQMTIDSVFRIASMTKPITSVAAMQLVEEGTFALDTPVSAYIASFCELRVQNGINPGDRTPIFRNPGKKVTLKHLLTHTAGFGYEMWHPLLRDMVSSGLLSSLGAGGDAFLKAPLVYNPGERWCYGINT